MLHETLFCEPLRRSRRTFLTASALGLAGWAVPQATWAAAAAAPRRKPARSTIVFFLSGGMSHIDTFDMKPEAPAEYRGPFEPIATTAAGVRVCEHLPMVARQMHHVAVINSLGHYGRGTGDHHAGYYYNLTGHRPDPSFRQLLNDRKPRPDDWPYMGSVVAAKRPPHPTLPSLITLPAIAWAPQYTRPGQFAARLGLQYDPWCLEGSREKPLDFAVPALELRGDVSFDRLTSRRELLSALDGAARGLEQSRAASDYGLVQGKAFALLSAVQTRTAFDITSEPPAVRERYGENINGMTLLMARRLVEAEVPFITVFWAADKKLASLCRSAGSWDTHGNNFNCLKDHLLPEFDRAFSALIEDLHQRGLLEETAVLVTSEMGRKPRIGDRRSGGEKGAGRDHWTECQTVLLAGGGVRGGQTYGASDKLAEYPSVKCVAPEHITKTIYYAMGIDDLTATDREGRPFNLLEDGHPLVELF